VIVGYLNQRFGVEVAHQVELASAALGVVMVLAVGGLWRRSRLRQQPAE
jgi:hypothetical protein